MDPLAEIKRGAKVMWGLGDYRPIADVLMREADALVRECRVTAGMRALDVAAGTGNFAVAAARAGADVVACDLAPQMLEWGRARTAADGADVEWVDADAEALPFGDGRFDIVGSTFGAMFAPRPDVVASELFRVTSASGTVAMTNWTADGYSGRTAALIASFAPRPPFPMPSATEWGDPEVVERRFSGLAGSVSCERRVATFRFPSEEGARAFFDRNTGGLVILRSMLPPDGLADLDRALDDLVREFAHVGEGGDVVLPNAYLRVVATKR